MSKIGIPVCAFPEVCDKACCDAAGLIDIDRQRAVIAAEPAQAAAQWLDRLSSQLWRGTEQRPALEAVA